MGHFLLLLLLLRFTKEEENLSLDFPKYYIDCVFAETHFTSCGHNSNGLEQMIRVGGAAAGFIVVMRIIGNC